jgi:thiosulfate dehydrogenase
MIKGLVLGIVLGVLLVAAGVYFYFATGTAPVAVTEPEIPFEHKLAKLALNAYLQKLPHPDPQVPADEKNYLEGADVYKHNCAVCHGLPEEPKTAIAEGMAPKPPQLFHGMGVTDDEAWESYWKAENGIRMTGMPGFKGRLTETQIWQVTVLLKNADKLSPAVTAALKSDGPKMAETAPAAPAAKMALAKMK